MILMIGGLVPWHPDAGGGQVAAYKLGEALSRAGHKVDYLAIAPKEYQRAGDWGTINYASEKRDLTSSMLRALQSVAGDHPRRYDLVHLHAEHGTASYCLAYAIRRRIASSPKFVMTLHSPKAYAPPRSLAEACWMLCSRSADAILAVSQFSRKDISNCYRIGPDKIHVIYNGVDTVPSRRAKEEWQRRRRVVTLLFCGRLNGTQQKGVDVLLAAMPLVLQRHDAVLNIVGTGPRLEQYRSEAARLGVANRVRFVGHVEFTRVAQYYATADILVLPSRKEGFPLVLPEAMACGLPVVATSVGGVPEIVADAETGLLVTPSDPCALADAINTLVSDPQRRRDMGIAGRERVEKYFTWDKVAKRVLESYHSIL